MKTPFIRICNISFAPFILVLFLSFASSHCLQADEKLSYYTIRKIGDTVETYGDGSYKGRFYAFTDEVSCYTCMQSLANIARQLAKSGDIQIILFMKVRNESSIERFKKDFKWDAAVVYDPAFAYHKLYGIKNGPICMLTNAAGKVVFIDTPGKASFDVKALNTALQSLDSADGNIVPQSDSLLVHRYPLKLRDGTLVGTWRTYWETYIPERNEFFFWDVVGRTALLVDSSGIVNKKMSLDELPKHHGSTRAQPLMVTGRIGNNSIPFINLNPDFTSTMYRWDFDTERIERLWDVFLPDSLVYNSCSTGLQMSDTTFLCGYWYVEQQSVVDNPKLAPMVIVDQHGKAISQLGVYEKEHRSLSHLHSFTRFSCCLDNIGNIYIVDSFSDTIRVYDQLGSFRRNVVCHYDSAFWNYDWREPFARLHKESPVEELMAISENNFVSITNNRGLLYDTVKQKIYVVYERRNMLNGVLQRSFFLHCPDEHRTGSRRDLALPGNAKPFHVQNGLIYCVEIINGITNLSVYTIPDWL